MSEPTIFDCEQAFARLDDYVDRELSTEEMDAVRRHLMVCEHCAEASGFEAELIDRLREKVARINVPSDLFERMKSAIAD